jgi:uncharacterized protein YpmB
MSSSSLLRKSHIAKQLKVELARKEANSIWEEATLKKRLSRYKVQHSDGKIS